MTTMRARSLRRGLGDWLLGLGLFAVLAVGLGGDPRTSACSTAAASDTVTTRAIELTSPPGPAAENAMVAALLRGPAPLDDPNRVSALVILGLTFSLMFTFNLAIWRHLRRVYASPRRGEWRRGH